MTKTIGVCAAIGVTCLLCGCSFRIPYHMTGEETVVQPGTGNFIRTTHWVYDDGYETTTTEVITPGNNTDRRRPEERREFVDLF